MPTFEEEKSTKEAKLSLQGVEYEKEELVEFQPLKPLHKLSTQPSKGELPTR